MPGNRALFDQAIVEANSAAWDQQWDKAIAAYRQALNEFPNDSTALTNLGLTLLATNRFEEALAVYQNAARVNPKDPVPFEKVAEIYERFERNAEATQAYVAVAELYLGQRDISKAIANWSHAARLDTDNLHAYSRLALAYERTGKPQDSARAYLSVARMMQRQGEREKAMQAATHAAQLDPQNPDAAGAVDMIQRGVSLPEPEQLRPPTGPLAPSTGFSAPPAGSAVRTAGDVISGSLDKKANPLQAGHQTAIAKLAEIMFEIGEDSAATGSADARHDLIKKTNTGTLRLPTRGKRGQIMNMLGQAIDLHTKGDYSGAASFYEKALRAGIEHAALHYTLAVVYLDLERYRDAVKQFQSAAGHPDYAAGAYYGMGLCQGRDGKMRDAVNSLFNCLRLVDTRTVSADRVDRLDKLYEDTLAKVGRDQTTEQLTQLGENIIAFLSGPQWYERVQQAREQLNAQHEDDTLAPVADMLTIPGAAGALESVIHINDYVKRNLLDTALDEAQYALQYAPNYLPVHVRMAEILLAQNRVDEALDKYKVVARLYEVRGDPGRSIRLCEQMTQLAPLNIDVRRNLIRMHDEQGNIDAAIAEYFELAQAHIDLADLGKARQTYTEALNLAQSPKAERTWPLKILRKLADLDMQRLDWRQALRVCEQIRNLAPGDVQARITLIDLNYRLGEARQAVTETDDAVKYFAGAGQLAAGIDVLAQLVQSHPSELALRSRLARAYQETGRKAEAITQLDAIGDLQMQAGRRADAVRTIQAIIALGPDNVSEYRQLLADMQTPG